MSNPFVNNETNSSDTDNQVMTVTRNDIAPTMMIEQLTSPNDQFYCSIKDDGTRKSKVAIFNAINSADESLGDHIGEVLEVVDVVAHPVTLTDENTGEIITALRTVLVTKNGKSYTAVSQGITNALSRVFSIVGMPSWTEEPVKMKVKQIKTRNGNNKVNTIELV